MARIESVSRGREQLIAGHPEVGRTGILKEGVDGPVRIGPAGLAGDHVHDKKHHGGSDQAVYIYFSEDYDWWSEELGFPVPPGTFGDNLTISGLDPAGIAVGDRFVIGDVVLEVTAPRIPCATLAARMDDPTFVKTYRRAERPGAYCRVIAEGEVAAEMPVSHIPFVGERLTLLDLFRAWFERKQLPPARVRRMLQAPVAIRVREDLSEVLRKAEAAA